MGQVFSKENKTLKNTGKVREFCQSGKVGTLTGKEMQEILSSSGSATLNILLIIA